MNGTIGKKYMFRIIVLYLLSGSIVWGGSREARQDIWLVMCVNAVLFAAIAALYGKLCEKHPNLDLFELCDLLLPKSAAVLCGLVYTGYAILICAISWWNFSQFTILHVLRELPKYAVVFLLAAVCVWCVKRGVRTLAHFTSFVFPFVLLILAITFGLSVKRMDLRELLPICYDLPAFWNGTFTMTAYPFGDIVLLFAVYKSMSGDASKAGTMTGGVFCAFGVLLLLMVRNVALLSVQILDEVNYATYHAMGVIGLEDFFKRIEVLLTFAVAFCDVVKGSVALLFACQGLKFLFHLQHASDLSAPTAFLTAGTALLLFDTNAQMDAFLHAFRYVSLPLQILAPGSLLLSSYLRRKTKKQKWIDCKIRKNVYKQGKSVI